MGNGGLSFRLRLVLAAAVWIGLGLAGSWIALQAIMRDHLTVEFQEELEHHAAELASLVVAGPDGQPVLRSTLTDHRFFEPGSGHYWQIDAANGNVLRSESLGDASLPSTPAPTIRPAAADGPNGPVWIVAHRVVPTGSDRPVAIVVGIEGRVIDDLLRRFRVALGLALTAVAAGLVAAVLAQVTYGLWPLVRVRQGLAAIAAGRSDRLSEDLPVEVAPLAASLNAMMAANDGVVRRARTQAGNLAHALQTPIAVLMDEGRRLQAAGQDGRTVLREAERMRRHIEFHLAHARASASRGRPHPAAPVLPAVRNLLVAMSRLYHARGLQFELAGEAEGAMVACEPEDLDQLLGNLIDNAAKWAASRVRVLVGRTDTGMIRIDVEDDGPGLPPDARLRIFQFGERLDESVAGHGLGLAIVREISTLYDGSISSIDSSLGGTCMRLELPCTG